MWIRRQDKEMLIKAVCIYLGGGNHICASSAEGNRWYIGEYSTREKALKVLDGIEIAIRDPLLLYSRVFSMPQDDEVE